jgi:hypothetical protein
MFVVVDADKFVHATDQGAYTGFHGTPSFLDLWA